MTVAGDTISYVPVGSAARCGRRARSAAVWQLFSAHWLDLAAGVDGRLELSRTRLAIDPGLLLMAACDRHRTSLPSAPARAFRYGCAGAIE